MHTGCAFDHIIPSYTSLTRRILDGVFEDIVTSSGLAKFGVEIPGGFLVKLFELVVGGVLEDLGDVAQDAVHAFPAGEFLVAFLDVFGRNSPFRKIDVSLIHSRFDRGRRARGRGRERERGAREGRDENEIHRNNKSKPAG